jgi:hypothetical protein
MDIENTCLHLDYMWTAKINVSMLFQTLKITMSNKCFVISCFHVSLHTVCHNWTIVQSDDRIMDCCNKIVKFNRFRKLCQQTELIMITILWDLHLQGPPPRLQCIKTQRL